MSELRFYLDENVQLAVAEQLERLGIDVVSVHSLGTLGDSDKNHLERVTEMARMLCTYDQDFLRLAQEGTEHAGIASGLQHQTTIGVWVKELRRLHASTSAEDAQNQIFFVTG